MQPLVLLLILGARLCAAFRSAVIVPCPSTCSTSLDCSLNGECSSGQCVCDPGWTGTCCGALSLAPVDYNRTSGGYRNPSTSTWGGNIIKNDSTQTYHMWIAEMKPEDEGGSGSCGLTTWGKASQITHVTSAAIAGPYARQEVAVPLWSHNPIVRQAPDGTYVLWHIGSGSSSNSTPEVGYCARNGTSPCGEQSFDKCGPSPNLCSNASVPGFECVQSSCMGADGNCGASLAEPSLNCDLRTFASCVPAAAAACKAQPGCVAFSLDPSWPLPGLSKAKLFGAGITATPNKEWTSWVSTAREDREREDNTCTLQLHSALSTEGPWVPYPNATISPCGGNNPGPYVHPNGTIFIVFTEQRMGLWRAESWKGPYTFVTSGACGGGEDPSLFINARGQFHCLYHRSPFNNVRVGAFSAANSIFLKVAVALLNPPSLCSTLFSAVLLHISLTWRLATAGAKMGFSGT